MHPQRPPPQPRFLWRYTAAVLASLMLTNPLLAAPPAWWGAQNVTPPELATQRDDYAVANIGQVKTLARKAMLQMDAAWPGTAGGAGSAVHLLVDPWEVAPAAGVVRDDYAAVNLGQLKTVAKPFYDRLIELRLRPANSYPWSNQASPKDDFSLANLGQLKTVFAFEILGDTDGDGMPDFWEIEHGLNRLNPDDAGPAAGYVDHEEPSWGSFADWDRFYADNELLGWRPSEEAWPEYVDMPAYNSAMSAWNLAPATDPDNDLLSNLREYRTGTDPRLADTDLDGFNDGVEVMNESDPLNALRTPIDDLSQRISAVTVQTQAFAALRANPLTTQEELMAAWQPLNAELLSLRTLLDSLEGQYSAQHTAVVQGTAATVNSQRESAGTTEPANQIDVVWDMKWVENYCEKEVNGDFAYSDMSWWDYTHPDPYSESYSSFEYRWPAKWETLGFLTRDQLCAPPISVWPSDGTPYATVNSYVTMSEYGAFQYQGYKRIQMRIALKADRPLKSGFTKTYLKVLRQRDFSTGSAYTYTATGTVTLTIPPSENGTDRSEAYDVELPEEAVNMYRTTLLLPVEIESKDRFLTGAFDTSIDLFQTAQVEFKNPSSGENLGSYKLDGSGGTHIYESKDDIFSEQELDEVVGGSVGAGSNKLNQKVVFWKDGSKVRFATTFEGVGSVEVSLSKSDGTSLGKITHALKADTNFSGLIDHLGARIDSINSQAEDQFSLMPDIDGIPDDDDPLPVLAAAIGATAASPPPAEAGSNNSWSATTRNLLSKVLIAARNAVDGIKTGAEYTYKVGGGFIKGYVDGVCDGVVSDVTGIGELAIMALESVTGDFHRAKAMYDGIATLASMTSEERGAVFDSMLVKFVDKSTTSVPWDPSEMNGADDWGISAYMAGYGGGFVTEQIVATMAVAGLVSKVGQGVKVALLGTKLGQITAAMIQGVRKFVTGAFLSISKHLKTYGEAAIKSVRLALGEVGAAIRGGAGGPTKKVGEWISEMMERVTPQKLKYQELADRLEKICQSRAEWVQLGPNAFWHVSGLAQWLGTHLTEHGVMGFMNLWKGALRHAVSGNYVHYLYKVCTVGGVLDKQGMARILEMFESTSQSAYKFIPDAQDVTKWTSPGGVIYGVGSDEGHRIMHILTHTVPNWANKTNHTVWNVARHEVFPLLDEAWAKKGTWVQALTKNGQPDPFAWICEMGRQVGVGNSTLTKIRVVLIRVGTDEIRSAYPVSSLMP